eukprot:TRINITY_DN45357_c0_g1_i1.p1 TRINITY_DN45357_c0_g1~~TRINITY_DN45357_c0_g1_i1.p1  ORF type:complete len:331 (+),score=45.57 TRINITY_DN45357_c0_g1_i1:102-995(+)
MPPIVLIRSSPLLATASSPSAAPQPDLRSRRRWLAGGTAAAVGTALVYAATLCGDSCAALRPGWPSSPDQLWINATRSAYSQCIAAWPPEKLRRQALLVRMWWTLHDFVHAARLQRWWIDYGTLLGWHREGRLMVRDYDVDVAFDDREWRRLQLQRKWLGARGCQLLDNSQKHKGRRKAVMSCRWFDPRPDVGADLYGFRFTKKHAHPPTYDGCALGLKNASLPCAICPIPLETFVPFNCSGTLHGRKVCTPRATASHLLRLYGTLSTRATCNRRKCCKYDPSKKYTPCGEANMIIY